MKPIAFQTYIFNTSRSSLNTISSIQEYLFVICFIFIVIVAMLYLHDGLIPQQKVNRDNPLFLSQRNVIFSHANQFVILIYDSIFTERCFDFAPSYICPEFTPDERSFVQFSRRRTEYLSNGLEVHEAYVYFMTSSATTLMLAMKISTVSP